MRFDLKRPCSHCPFRNDRAPYLNAKRARTIAESLVQHTFACHETTVDTGAGEREATVDSQHCAGALIMLEHARQPSQMMRIAERLRIYDRQRLDMASPVFQSPFAFVGAHRRSR
jgi:hypothetical protein